MEGIFQGYHAAATRSGTDASVAGATLPAVPVVSKNLNTMPTPEEMQAEIERLRAENETLKKPARGQLSLRVSEKGALSVYGMGRFPVTLYREQWGKLLGMADVIKEFIKANDQALKKKE